MSLPAGAKEAAHCTISMSARCCAKPRRQPTIGRLHITELEIQQLLHSPASKAAMPEFLAAELALGFSAAISCGQHPNRLTAIGEEQS
jgi:hypothetical protein